MKQEIVFCKRVMFCINRKVSFYLVMLCSFLFLSSLPEIAINVSYILKLSKTNERIGGGGEAVKQKKRKTKRVGEWYSKLSYMY